MCLTLFFNTYAFPSPFYGTQGFPSSLGELAKIGFRRQKTLARGKTMAKVHRASFAAGVAVPDVRRVDRNKHLLLFWEQLSCTELKVGKPNIKL